MVVTFVPFFDVAKIYSILDLKRKNKQITECIEMINALEGHNKGYSGHPAALMWQDNIDALKTYHNIMLRLWYAEGYSGSRKEYKVDEANVTWPWWWGWETLALSHKLSLRRKKPEHYTNGLLELKDAQVHLKNKCGYIWPTHVLAKHGKDLEQIFSLSIEELCDPIGAGAPIQYQWSLTEVEVWEQNPARNPRTGRPISSTAKAGVYQQLVKVKNYYISVGLITTRKEQTFYWTLQRVLQWRACRERQPITKQKIAPKTASWKQLAKAEAYYIDEYYIVDLV